MIATLQIMVSARADFIFDFEILNSSIAAGMAGIRKKPHAEANP
jgi:hypothetical protein